VLSLAPALAPPRYRSAVDVVVVALLAAMGLVLAACGATAQPGHSAGNGASTASPGPLASAPASAVSEAPCGGTAPALAAQAVMQAAERIYRLELSSAEVRVDQRQVEGYAPLLAAVVSGKRTAITEAVTSLVYSHTHIVRLRVSRGGTVLADVGGPYIIAPVRGSLRLKGRTIGSYVLSVQDDVGYVKLETRYTGVPLLLRLGARPVPIEGLIAPGSATIPDSGAVRYRGRTYQAASFTAEAFPSGALKVTLLVPPPPAGLGCGAIKAFEMGSIAQTMWRRFASVGVPPSAFVKSASTITGALIYVRSGSRQLAGSTSPGPKQLPAAGTVSYRGIAYRVTSFTGATAEGPVRVFELVGQ
jgi:hypothetical protein